ncbi:MAG: hypothetical protein GY724_11585 [Actinomycetia bacterium]|nr:hypothetical protein [Actinomycetes bacterium]MCP5030838.1 hypothetical protein [Actinomycetes bacterium]
MSSVDLPDDWEGVCLEYIEGYQRIIGRFPHGTRSSDAPANINRVTTTMPSSS